VVVQAGDVHDALQSALAALAAYRRSPTFAFIDPDGVEARWKLLEALATHKAPTSTKVELFLLLASPQIVRVVNDSLDPHDLEHAKQQITELTNLMRWRLEKTLGYGFTHTLRLTNVYGVPLYDMIFATDHAIGDKIMRSVYQKAAERFSEMRQEARARRRDRKEQESGFNPLFTHAELVQDAPLRTHESYQHAPPVSPYGQTVRDPG